MNGRDWHASESAFWFWVFVGAFGGGSPLCGSSPQSGDSGLQSDERSGVHVRFRDHQNHERVCADHAGSGAHVEDVRVAPGFLEALGDGRDAGDFHAGSSEFGAGVYLQVRGSDRSSRNVPQKVVFADSNGEAMTFRFAEGSSLAACTAQSSMNQLERLQMVDAEGWATAEDPCLCGSLAFPGHY